MANDKEKAALVSSARIEKCILFIRGEKVLLDADLADLYGAETKALTRAVRRNIDRFPADFMFQLTAAEFDDLRCQFGVLSSWGGRRYRPYAFTEQGVAMLDKCFFISEKQRRSVFPVRLQFAFFQILTSHFRGLLTSLA